MKKKIKDLTIAECVKICSKQIRGCAKCPIECMRRRMCWSNGLDESYEDEVEVDE